jgi:hypothetical protein
MEPLTGRFGSSSTTTHISRVDHVDEGVAARDEMDSIPAFGKNAGEFVGVRKGGKDRRFAQTRDS